ncbi:tyrosine-type recombinase/integrase [Sulfitobacter sp. MF3-043]|uniref:tyrosine-type recombinase/integrase n=1 Tax=Sulfitobacter sediminivivens TaxID=3252902 RepID=UPI0036DBE99B
MKLRSMYRWYCNEWFASSGETISNPCDRLDLPKARKTRETVISRNQLAALLGEMTPLLRQIVELAYETAMRRSEILKLRACDLHLDERFLRVVEGKEGSRDVPLTKRAVRLLQYAVNRSEGEGVKLYPVAPYSVSQAVRRSRLVLGMSDDIRFHQLRHSRITEVARKGLNLSQIMVVSGHRDIRSVQRYTHLNVQDVIDLIE